MTEFNKADAAWQKARGEARKAFREAIAAYSARRLAGLRVFEALSAPGQADCEIPASLETDAVELPISLLRHGGASGEQP